MQVSKKFLAVTGVLAAASGSAMAAVPDAATDAITGLVTDGGSMIAAAWPVAGAITGGLALIKIFKKATNRAT